MTHLLLFIVFAILFNKVNSTSNTKRYIIKYKNDTGRTNAIKLSSRLAAVSAGLNAQDDSSTIALSNQHAIAASYTIESIEELSNSSGIDYIEEDSPRYLLGSLRSSISTSSSNNNNNRTIPRRRHLEQTVPYGYTMVQANQVNNIIECRRKICIIDSGYDLFHPDLPGYDGEGFTGDVDGSSPIDALDYPWFEDRIGHGSHVSGIIAAIDNEIGMIGVVNDSKLHIVRMFGGNEEGGSKTVSSLLGAVSLCRKFNASIINMSLGGSKFSQTEQTVFEETKNAGILLVAAAGNNSTEDYFYPASYDSVLSVAAIDGEKKQARFSQFNDQVDIAAPGVDILSTLPTNLKDGEEYDESSGTSMASPFVAGVAALIWSHFPGCNNTEIRQALIETAEDLGDPGRDNSTGFGLVQAKKAFDYLIYNPCVNDTICPSSDVTRSPSVSPTLEPTKSMSPTPLPTLVPVTVAPTNTPSSIPTSSPSSSPSTKPSLAPTTESPTSRSSNNESTPSGSPTSSLRPSQVPSGISTSVEADVQLLLNGLSSELDNETKDVFENECADHLNENLVSFNEFECILTTIPPSFRQLHRNLQEGGIYVNLHVEATSSDVDAALSTFTEQVHLVFEESADELVADLKEQHPSYFETLSGIEVNAVESDGSNSPTKSPCRWSGRLRERWCGKSGKKSKSAKIEEAEETPTTSIKTGKSSKSSKKKQKVKDVESLVDIKRERKHAQAMSIITLPEVDEKVSS